MHLVTLNAAGAQLARPRVLDPRARRLSQVIGRYVDRARPHMIAVQRARDPLQPIEEAWVLRGRDKRGQVKPWPRMYLPADAIVVVVYLPRGGGGGGGSSRGKGLNIALSIAAIALIAFAGPAGTAAAGALALEGAAATIAAAAVQATLVIGGSALLSIASRSRANRQATDTTQIYGVAGGGNLPRPGDRIPRGYGRSWMKPDLSQPDFSQYDGDDQILFKRHTLGLGRYRPYQVRAGKQVIWKQDGGFQAPFNDDRNAIEFVSGAASALVPSTVVSASGIGGLLPRPGDNPSIAGPFPINQRGAPINRIQFDFQFPQGISRTETLRSGTVRSNQPGAWSVVFQYAPIDESGAVTGPWQNGYAGNSGTEGARFATHPLRYTRFVDVPPGRYAVRGWNVQPDSTGDPNNATIDACQWDGASGWVADAAIREGVTEMALRIYATKASQAAAFGEVEIDAAAIVPVWTGTAWEDRETSKAVWAFLDILRDADYGGGLPDDQLDLETARAYADRLTEFDTFDGTIRGPISVHDAAATVLLPMRAEPVHTGRFWSLVRDEPKAVRRHVVTRRQILKGTSEIAFDLDTASGAGHVIGEFDDGGDYRNPNQTTAIYGEASITPTRQRWSGVRTFAHAQHLTRWRAASGAYRRQSTPFGVEMEGRIYRRGDSISVDHWFIDTALTVGILGRKDGNTLLTDTTQEIPQGWHITLRDPTGREWGAPISFTPSHDGRELYLNVAEIAAAESATGIGLDEVVGDGLREMTSARMGPLEVLRENYLIRSVRMSGPDRAQVEAQIDDPRVWEAIGAPIVAPPAGGAGNADPEVPRILALTANAVQMTAGLRCDYAIRPGRGAVRYEVQLSYDGGGAYQTIAEGSATTGSHMLNPVEPTTVRLRARAFGATGLPGPYYVTALALPRSTVADPDLEDLFAEVDRAIDEVAAIGEAELRRGLAILLDVTRDLNTRLEEMANAAATEAGQSYLQRQFNKVAAEGRAQDSFAAIQRVDEARISDAEAFSGITTTLGARLTTAEGNIVGQAVALQSVTTRVTNAEGVVTAQGQAITNLTARVDNAELNISGQATATQQLTTRVVQTENSIQSLSTQYTALQSRVTDAEGVNTSQATAIQGLNTAASNLDGRVTASSTQIGVLNTVVGGHTSTLTQYGASIDGVRVQYGVTGSIDGQTGGFVLEGVRRNDGQVSYTLRIKADVIADGAITARTLAAQQLILNGQIFDGAVSTIGGDENASTLATYYFTNTRPGGTRLAILGFYNPGGVRTVSQAVLVGSFEIRINDAAYASKPGNSVPGNNGFYLLGDSISKQIGVGGGTFKIQAYHTNPSGGSTSLLVIELSK